jgi:hypothetical protein
MPGIITGPGINSLSGGIDPNTGGSQQNDTQQANSVQGMRLFLRNQGYDIPLHGDTIGPLMQAALHDWHQGSKNPKAFNSKYADPTSGGLTPQQQQAKARGMQMQDKYGKAGLTGFQPTNNGQKRNDAVAAGKTTGGKAIKSGKTTTPTPNSVGGGSGGGGYGGGGLGMDPKMLAALMGGSSNKAVQRLAQSMTNAQYTAPMDLLQSQIDQENNADQTRQTDIGNWFQNLIEQNKTGNQNDIKGSDALVGQSNDLAANILKSIGADGGAGASEVGKATMTDEGLLQALNQNQQDYGRNMNTALALSGRDAKNSDAYQSKQTTKGLLDQLMALTQQKGQSLAANLSAAQDQILKDKSQRINNFATLAMLNPQMNAAKLSNAYTRARINATNANAAAAAKAAKQGQAVDMSKLQTSVFSQLPMGSTPGQLAPNIGRQQVGAVISATLKGAGIKRGTPLYTNAARAIASGLTDSNGKSMWDQLASYFTN